MTPLKYLLLPPWNLLAKNQIKSLVTFLIVLCCVVSLKAIVASSENNERAEIQSGFKRYLYQGNYDSAMIVNDHYLERYKETGDSIHYARYATNLGALYYFQSQYSEALAYFSNALPFINRQVDPRLTGLTLNDISASYRRLGDYKSAFLYCQRALEEWKALDDQEGMAISMTHMADQYLKMGYIDSAIAISRKCIQISAANGYLIQNAEAKVMLGKAYLMDNNPDSTLHYCRVSIPLFEENGFLIGIASAQGQMGKAYLQQNRLHAAADMFEQAVSLYKQLGVAKYQMTTQLHLADAYLKMDFLTKAESMVDSTELLAESTPFSHYHELEHLYHVKYRLADAQGDSLTGHRYYRAFILYRDSVLAAEDKSQLKVLKLSHDLARKEAAIFLLSEKYTQVKTRSRFYLLTGLVIGLGLTTVIIFLKRKMVTIETGRSKVVQDLDLLQQNYLISGGKDLTAYTLDKENIEAKIDATLNDTDWNLLQALIENPNGSNKLLASQISISHEGVRSSLKKMYRLFKVEDNVANKKLALSLAAVAASK